MNICVWCMCLKRILLYIKLLYVYNQLIKNISNVQCLRLKTHTLTYMFVIANVASARAHQHNDYSKSMWLACKVIVKAIHLYCFDLIVYINLLAVWNIRGFFGCNLIFFFIHTHTAMKMYIGKFVAGKLKLMVIISDQIKLSAV